MKRYSYFRKQVEAVRTIYSDKGKVCSPRAIVAHLKADLPPEKWESIKHIIDPRSAKLPHHLNLDYDKKKAKAAIAAWAERRALFMFGPYRCLHCGATEGPLFRMGQVGVSFRGVIKDYCSDSCSKKNDKTKALREQTCLERYGVTNVTYSEAVKVKQRASAASKTDEDYRLMREKRDATYVVRHGSVKGAIRQRVLKATATNQLRYGGNAPTCDPSVRAKVVATNMRVRGVPNPSQDPEVMAKIRNAFRNRKQVTSQGKTFTGLQGYEHLALHWLIYHKLIEPTRIVVPDRGVAYKLEGKRKLYFPDLVIDGKCFIEVKSEYTACIVRDDAPKNKWGSFSELRAKIKACAREGLDIKLVIPVVSGARYHGCFVWSGPLPTRRKLRIAYLEFKALAVGVPGEKVKYRTPGL